MCKILWNNFTDYSLTILWMPGALWMNSLWCSTNKPPTFRSLNYSCGFVFFFSLFFFFFLTVSFQTPPVGQCKSQNSDLYEYCFSTSLWCGSSIYYPTVKFSVNICRQCILLCFFFFFFWSGANLLFLCTRRCLLMMHNRTILVHKAGGSAYINHSSHHHTLLESTKHALIMTVVKIRTSLELMWRRNIVSLRNIQLLK